VARLLGLRNPLPRLRRTAGRVRRHVHDWWRGETAGTLFDVRNLRELNEALAAVPGAAPLVLDPRQAGTGPAGAMHFTLALLATHPRLRSRFPTALSDGVEGAFHGWLTTDGVRRYRLGPAAVEHLTTAFTSNPSARARRVFECRPDLRNAFPVGLTPHPQRRDYLAWLLVWGPGEFGLTPEESLWYLFELEETPDRGLVPTYLLQPAWQEAVPHALTPFGWDELKNYLRSKYGLQGRWFEQASLTPVYRPWDDLLLLRQARPALSLPAAGGVEAIQAWAARQPGLGRPSADWWQCLRADLAAGLPDRPGVNVIGHFRYESGLQQAVLGVVDGLTRAGVRTIIRDLPVKFDCDWGDRHNYHGVELYDTTIYVAAVNTFPSKYMPWSGIHRRDGVRRIAVWYWELEDLPADWTAQIRWPDEVWAPTRFIADTFRKVMTVPVLPMLPGVELPAFDRKPKSHFGLPDDRFLFLFSFDMGSVMARKNPLGLIEAYRRAFRSDDRVHLAIKVSRGESDPDAFARLKAAAAGSGVTVINRVLSRSDTLALLAACDCYTSLHRSEGLGLGLAETMLMGKPVIATAYSGNMDFMTPQTGYLVDYRRVPIEDDPYELSPYPKGCLWADPSIEHAVVLMRQVFDHADEARAVGARARQSLESLLSMDAYAKRMAARVRPAEAERAVPVRGAA
jgi:glycosyltransferase involved in cell wall biosynthesis